MTAAERKPRPRAGFFDAPKDEPKHRRLLRYWGQDVAQGMLDLALHYAMRAMPIAWCSALGGWLGELTGRYRLKVSAQRARNNYRRFGGAARLRSSAGTGFPERSPPARSAFAQPRLR